MDSGESDYSRSLQSLRVSAHQLRLMKTLLQRNARLFSSLGLLMKISTGRANKATVSLSLFLWSLRETPETARETCRRSITLSLHKHHTQMSYHQSPPSQRTPPLPFTADTESHQRCSIGDTHKTHPLHFTVITLYRHLNAAGFMQHFYFLNTHLGITTHSKGQVRSQPCKNNRLKNESHSLMLNRMHLTVVCRIINP